MRVERLSESRAAILEMSLEEAAGVTAVGRRLASQSSGLTSAGGSPERSVIECLPYGQGQWSVRVPNAVGVVRVGDLQLVIEPKVPLPHLLYLFERSGTFPRLDATAANLKSAETLWPLVAAWYLASLERLLRSGLASGYRQNRDELSCARGRVLAAATATAFMKGRVKLDCEFEEFDVDTALNRVLKAAAMRVATSAALSWDLRRRATRSVHHLEGISDLQPLDLAHALPERHTTRYVLPLQLARHVLAATGRGIEPGAEAGFAFLIRTPDMVEEALRRIVGSALEGRTAVSKRTRYLSGSHHSLTPDLSFGHTAVGDVKYKVWAGDWDRGDLYQLVAFATGFRVREGLRVGFADAAHGNADVQVGEVRLSACDWAYGSLSPIEAEEDLGVRLREWWDRVAISAALSVSSN